MYNRSLGLMEKGKDIERKAIPAYQDTSLADRPDEKWEPMPELEQYFMVSNFGRIKDLQGMKCIGTAVGISHPKGLSRYK